MKVLITGASGFIGSHLAEKLSQRGINVRCLVRPESNIDFLKRMKNIELFEGDLLKPDSFLPALRGVEKVFHLAAVSQTREDVDYSFFQKYIVQPTKNLALSALENKVKKFIFYSSIEAVGLRKASALEKPIDETATPSPETKYGRAKLEAEQLLLSYLKKGLPVVIIRPSVVYGARDITHGPLKLFRSLKSGIFHLVGNGQNWVSWCYVENLIEATTLAAEKPVASYPVYFINDEKPYRFAEIVKAAARVMGVEVSPWKIPLTLAKIACLPTEFTFSLLGKDPLVSRSKLRLATQNFVYDISKAKKELGYRPIYSLDEGIKKTISWYQENGYL